MRNGSKKGWLRDTRLLGNDAFSRMWAFKEEGRKELCVGETKKARGGGEREGGAVGEDIGSWVRKLSRHIYTNKRKVDS